MSNLRHGSFGDHSSDPFGFDEESVEEERARVLMENDLDLLWTLRQAREARNLTQADLAERMGISQPSLAAFESQSNDPKLSTIRRYAFALGVMVDHVVFDVAEDANQWKGSTVVTMEPRVAQPRSARSGWRAS